MCADCGVDLVADDPTTIELRSRRTGPTGPAFRDHCPRCGVPLPQEPLGEWFRTSERCAECGVAVVVDAPLLRPTEGEIAFALDGLSLTERTAVTAGLIERRLPFRWDDDLVLVVPPALEAHIDRLIADVTGENPAYEGMSE